MSINNAGFNPQIQGQMPINYQAQAARAPYPAPFVQAQPVIYNMPSAQIYAPQAQQVNQITKCSSRLIMFKIMFQIFRLQAAC